MTLRVFLFRNIEESAFGPVAILVGQKQVRGPASCLGQEAAASFNSSIDVGTERPRPPSAAADQGVDPGGLVGVRRVRIR
jgi:hypothetical protein